MSALKKKISGKEVYDAVPTDFETNQTVNFNATKQNDIGKLIKLTEELLNKPTYIVLDTGQLVGGIGDGVDKAYLVQGP